MVVEVFDLVQVPFNPDSVDAMHFRVVNVSQGDTPNGADVKSSINFDFSVLNSKLRLHDGSGGIQIRLNRDSTDNT